MIGKIAARQGGRVTRQQLIDAGLNSGQIKYRSQIGRLIPEHRDVYRVGYRPKQREGRWRAALLAVEDSALALWDASMVHELWFSSGPWIHLVVDGYSGRNHRDDVRVHRMRLPERHVVEVDGMRVTSVARTVVDMAFAMTSPKQLVHVLDRAERRDDFDLVDLGQVVGAFKRRKGIPDLRRLVDHRHPDSSMLDTALERACADLLARFPPSRYQYVIDGYRADFAWPDLKIILEVDGFEWHKTRADANKDAKRALELEAAGWRVLRLTDDQVYWRPEWAIATLTPIFSRSLSR